MKPETMQIFEDWIEADSKGSLQAIMFWLWCSLHTLPSPYSPSIPVQGKLIFCIGGEHSPWLHYCFFTSCDKFTKSFFIDFLPPIRTGNVTPFSLCIFSLSFGFRCPSLLKSRVSSLPEKRCKTVFLSLNGKLSTW